MPAYVTNEQFVLAKAAPAVRNTYEIRLAIYLAMQRNLAFTLAVSTDAVVDAELQIYIEKWGGQVSHDDIRAFSVSFSAESANGEDLDTWVLGDDERWADVSGALASPWLRDRLRLGGSFADADLSRLANDLALENLAGTNVDGEALKPALLSLVALARRADGCSYNRSRAGRAAAAEQLFICHENLPLPTRR